MVDADVSGGIGVGALAGGNEGTVSACYVTGSIASSTSDDDGDAGLGAIVGSNDGTISASYSTAAVSGDGNEPTGGLVGANDGTITASYWNTQTSGQSNGVGEDRSSGAQGKTTAQLRVPTGYTGIYAQWDDTLAGDTWDFGSSREYPELKLPIVPGGSGSSTGSNTASNPIDRAALIAFYVATGERNWVDNDSWLSSAPINEWYGVSTNSSGRVVSIDLPGNGLSGSIPSSLGVVASAEIRVLPNLSYLNVENNRLSGGDSGRTGPGE